MKQFLRKHLKAMLLIIIIILGFVLYYEVLPRYNQTVLEIGYNKALNDLANEKAVVLRVAQQEGNETINQIIPISVCSDIFIQEYQNICGVQG